MTGRSVTACLLLALVLTHGSRALAEASPTARLLVPRDSTLAVEVVEAASAQMADHAAELRTTVIDQLPQSTAAQGEIARTHCTGAIAVFWFDPSLRISVLVSQAPTTIHSRDLSAAGVEGFAESFAIVLRAVVQALVHAEQTGPQSPVLSHEDWEQVSLPAPAGEAAQTDHIHQRDGPLDERPETPSPSDERDGPADEEAETPSPGDQREGTVNEEPRPKRFFVAWRYRFEPWTSFEVFHAFDVELCVRLFRGLTISFAYGFVLPAQVSSSGVDLTLRSHPFRLGLGYMVSWSRLWLLARAFVVLDPLAEDVDASPPLNGSEGTELEVSVGATTRLGIRIVGPLSVVIDAGLSLPLNRARHVIRFASGDQAIALSWQVRPFLGVGLLVEVF